MGSLEGYLFAGLRRIDIVDFEVCVGRWIQVQLGKDDAPHLSIDGKTARGSRDGSTPGVHLVSAYAPDVKAVLAQLRVDAKTNEHKAALELLGVLAVKDKISTGDAMFTDRDFCAKVIEGGGDYVLPVKENQPTLGKDIAAAFAEPEASLSPLQAARARPKSTGIVRSTRGTAGSRSARSRSRRRWPSTWGRTGRDAQVFRLTRERKTGEKVETEVVHGIASLPRERAGAREPLHLTRGPLGDRERPARRAGRDAPRGRQPDQERVGDAGDGHRGEHRHLRLQPAGLQERRGRHASLRLPPPRDTGNPVKTNLRTKRPWARGPQP